MALYGLKSSGASFRSKSAGVLHNLDYIPTMADPDVWIKPAAKPDRSQYYDMVLCYVDDVLAILHKPMETIEGIKVVFKLKGNKAEPPEMYLGAALQKVDTSNGGKCWAMSLEEYIRVAVKNLEERLGMNGNQLPSRYNTPMSKDYQPSKDTSCELDSAGILIYQELIGLLHWAVEIRRVDVLLGVSLLSSHLALSRIGHLQAVYRLFGCLKQCPKRRLYFDPMHPSIPEERFLKFDSDDFYKDVKEPIPMIMSQPIGRSMSTH